MPMLVLAALLAAAAPAPGCLDVRSGNAPVSLEGRLERATFTTPDVGNGQPERDYVLILARPICVDDGGEFADPHQRFRQVQLYTSHDALWPRLRAGVGHRIRITGSGFAAHTAHHHTPLVVDVGALRRVGR
jgi:hypothetical protein